MANRLPNKKKNRLNKKRDQRFLQPDVVIIGDNNSVTFVGHDQRSSKHESSSKTPSTESFFEELMKKMIKPFATAIALMTKYKEYFAFIFSIWH
jgi:hypothetical protein